MSNKIYIKDKVIIFNNIPRPIVSKFRPIYKIAQIVMILYKCSRAKSASLLKLSFFNFILKSEENMELAKDIFKSNNFEDCVNFNIKEEPSFEKALFFAIEEGFIKIHEEKYILTEKGIKLGLDIDEVKDLFVKEKMFMKEIKTKIGEEKIKDLLG